MFWKLFEKWAWGAGLRTNHFRLIKRALALSISNRLSHFRSFYDNKWSSKKICQMHFGKIRGLRVRFIHSLITLNLENGTRASDYTSNQNPPKFFKITLSIYTSYAPRAQLKSFALRDVRVGGFHPERHNFPTFKLH